MNLSSKNCVPCRKDVPPMERAEAERMHKETPSWELIEKDGVLHLIKSYLFADFADALKFVNRVGVIAEQEGHHPNIHVHDWNKVDLEIFTHKIKGLHENDFILAAKVDALG